MLCEEHCIGSDGEYCGDNDAQLGRINVLYREASSDKYVPCAVFSDLEPGMIGAVVAARLGLPSGKPREPLAQNYGAP